DSNGRTTDVTGAVSGIKTHYDYFTSGDADTEGFLQDVLTYKDATNYLTTTVLKNDLWGNVVGVQTPDSTVSSQTFDADRNSPTERREAMAGQTTCTTTDSSDIKTDYVRDSALRITQLTRPDGSCEFWEYDSSGHLTTTKRRDDCNAASSGNNESYSYSA